MIADSTASAATTTADSTAATARDIAGSNAGTGYPPPVSVLLTGAEAEDPSRVGYKFARQAELRRLGFPVPEFFCIPGAAFDAVVGHLGVTPGRHAHPAPPGTAAAADPAAADPAPADFLHTPPEQVLTPPEQVLAMAGKLRERVAQAEVPPELATRLLDRFDALVGRDGLVAVRACAVTSAHGVGEDCAADPFAGMSDSFLYVPRADLLRRVADCWASAFNQRAVQYRLLRGVPPLAASIAVGVQRMVPAVRSFVAFSRDPLDGARRCLVAAGYGVGEGVVQESADLDHYTVDRDSGSVHATVAHKTRMVGADPTGAHPAAVRLAVPAALADTPVLTDAEATHIADLAVQLERHYRSPQDIEGAITADGTIMLVQARPAVLAGNPPEPTATTAPPAPTTFSNSNAIESYPGVCGALTWSVAADLCELVFTDFYRRMGVPAKKLRTNRYELRRMLAHLNGRVYYRLDSWYHLHSQLPGFDLLRSTWEPAIGMTRTDPDRSGGRAPGRVRTLRYTAWQAVTLLPRHVRTRRQVRRFIAWWDGYFAAAMDARPGTPGDIVDEYQRLWAQLGEWWGLPSVNNFHGLVALRLTNSLVARWAPGAGRASLTGMLCGGTENRSAAALRSAVELAERVRAHPELHAALTARDHRQVWAEVAAGQFGQELRAAALAHIRRYGDRGPQDLKMESETARSAPWTLLSVLRAYADQSLTAAGNRQREREVRMAAERELRAHCPGRVRRRILQALYAVQRESARMREDTRFCRSQIMGVCREMLLALGADLARAGLVEHERDVLDLTVPEVLGGYQGTLAGGDLTGLVRWRRAQREAWQREPDPPARIQLAAPGPLVRSLPAAGRDRDVPSAPAPPRLLTGIGSSPGRVRAQARVVHDPRIDASRCRDRILVARQTDPGWLFLMMGARGMVVEHGSPLSHTAITGRVLAIPTVVAVAGATRLIRDGDWVELDGTTGTVHLPDVPA